VAYAQIDWHDFVVVETVDFQYGEIGNFPPPTTPDQVGVRTLMQERVDNGEEAVEMSDAEDDMQVDSDDEMEKRVNGRMYAPESELRVPGEEKSSRDNNQVIYNIFIYVLKHLKQWLAARAAIFIRPALNSTITTFN